MQHRSNPLQIKSRQVSNSMNQLNQTQLLAAHSDAESETDPNEARRDELCLQLAENVYDLGAVAYSREVVVGGKRYFIQVNLAPEKPRE